MRKLLDKLARRLGYIPKSEQQVVGVKKVYLNAIEIRHEVLLDCHQVMDAAGGRRYMERCEQQLVDAIFEEVRKFIEFDYVKDKCFRMDNFGARIFIAKRERKQN